MDRGELLRIAEQGANPAVPEHATRGEAYIARHLPLMKAELMGKILGNLDITQQWAAIVRTAPTPQEAVYLNGAITILSGFVQEERFQTDEAVTERDGIWFYQFTTFWGNGKQAYEEEHGLGIIDEELVAEALQQYSVDA